MAKGNKWFEGEVSTNISTGEHLPGRATKFVYGSRMLGFLFPQIESLKEKRIRVGRG